MTPFGDKLRDLRRSRDISQKAMAEGIGVTPAYLSALEHGHRGAPGWALVQRIIAFLNVIWDEAEELQDLAERSHPRVVVDTAGRTAGATAFANALAKHIGDLDDEHFAPMLRELEERVAESLRKRQPGADAGDKDGSENEA